MKFTKRLTKKDSDDEIQRLIRDEMRFLLERNERWFEKHLQAHLFDEGCNFPIVLAKPRFYELMVSGLLAGAKPAIQKQVETMIPDSRENASHLAHESFYKIMCFLASKLDDSGKQMAFEVTNSIQTIQQEWQLDTRMFQEDYGQFAAWVDSLASQLVKAHHMEWPDSMSCEHIRRRVYLALTTSLLGKMNVRQAFEGKFDSISSLLKTMQNDHTHFCRFMAFCQERTPYFSHIVSRTFWRTLETLRLENVVEPPYVVSEKK